jgi:O-antigen/teichoic acid export membrane protein
LIAASAPADDHRVWGREVRTSTVVAHNVTTRYLAYLIDAALGLVMLPFNLHHLGMAAYGLWMVTSSVTAYLSMLDLGYGGALVRFVAKYRARRDVRAVNEVMSTLAVVYTAIGAVAYLVVLVLAANLEWITRVSPEQAGTSRALLLIIGANISLRFVFAIYGGIIVGFQRYHLNNLTSIGISLTVAAANVIVLLLGGDVVALVAVTTAVRVLGLLVYKFNAGRVFPGLSIKWALFSRERLREVTGFSLFMLGLDAAYKVNYSSDVMVIGALLGAPAVALWAPAQRLCEVTLRLSNQVSEALFPVVVDCDAGQRDARLRQVFIEGTRLSLATVLPIAGGLVMMAHPLLTAWLGHSFSTTASVVQLLACVVIVRVGASTASVILKGAGMHRRLTVLATIMAVANLSLSVALARPMGLFGVALGTLVPVTLVAVFGYLPAACKRVQISFAEMVGRAIWPAAWPAAVAGALLYATRSRMPISLSSVALQCAFGGITYFLVFLLAIGTESRREYMRHLERLLRRRTQPLSQVGTVNAS